jgi:hypothetical protein
MPYIEYELREEIEKELDALILRLQFHDSIQGNVLLTKQITYSFFKILSRFYGQDGMRWYYREDALKVLNACHDEFVRRFTNPAEDRAMKINGDVI